MASQLLPLGQSRPTTRIQLTYPELIDKCVGSRLWVIMKGDKGRYKSIAAVDIS